MAKANGMIIKVQPRQYSTSNFATKSSEKNKKTFFLMTR